MKDFKAEQKYFISGTVTLDKHLLYKIKKKGSQTPEVTLVKDEDSPMRSDFSESWQYYEVECHQSNVYP